jgi:hypothetical protein
MASTRTNARKQGQRMKQLMRQRQMLRLRQKGEKLIPNEILAKLAALNWPPNEFVYQACLEKLLRGM